MMRKYSKCEWCGKTIDVTHRVRGVWLSVADTIFRTHKDLFLCWACDGYYTQEQMLKARKHELEK